MLPARYVGTQWFPSFRFLRTTMRTSLGVDPTLSKTWLGTMEHVEASGRRAAPLATSLFPLSLDGTSLGLERSTSKMASGNANKKTPFFLSLIIQKAPSVDKS
jgi:hypothetical protein